MKEFKGKNILVYGSGVSGKAAARAVKRRGGTANIYSDVDGDEKFDAPAPEHYDLAVISPGIPFDHEIYTFCKKNGIRTVNEAELGFLLSDAPIVGVTGTNGKTTVTRLIADMLGGTACGNIGYPLCAAVEKKGPLVCEISSFMLKDAEFIRPHVAVITNIGVDHIDRHGSVEEYRRCKCNIARFMGEDDYLILGPDITVGELKYLETRAKIIYTSLDRPVAGAYIEKGFFCFFGRRVCHIDYLRLAGEHNLKNALVAIAAAKCAGAENSAILSAISSAEPASHRLAEVGVFAGKRWIDDSKSTNVMSCLAALSAIDGDVCLIVGGRDKALDFGELFSALPNRAHTIAMGECAADIAREAERCGKRVEVVGNLESAVAAAARSGCPTVLLSPACASFDEFKNYAERGDRFAALVKRLGKNEKTR